jgi:hypothetical protein
MKICGVELTANDAVVCLLTLEQGQFTLPECRVRKVSLPKEHTRADLQKFQATFAKLMADYQIEQVVIKERMSKGKFAGGAVSFKLEAAIELIADIAVSRLSPSAIKQALADNPLPIDFAETGLKGFQEQAFIAAYAAHVQG